MSTTTKGTHTPGPWVADGRILKTGVDYLLRGAAGDKLGIIRATDMAESVAFANARLIAASPDLLASAKADLHDFCELRALVHQCMEGEDRSLAMSIIEGRVIAINTALAKAEGGA